METRIQDIVIAVDGHSSCGKSTVAKDIAKKTGFKYIDSGAMYRAVTLFSMKQNLVKDKNIDLQELKKSLDQVNIDFRHSEKGTQETWLNNINVENEIRTLEVSNLVSYISEIDFVREKLVDLQQKLGIEKRIVMDGRDIGTVVFPRAELKIFMTASPEIRAKRRYEELLSKGQKVSFDEVLANIEKRDYIDQNREVGPLKKANDAILLDNSNLTREEQLNWVMEIIIRKFSK
ncbi:MAG: (d)CMP kinase [Bacteroidales bacterium]